MTNTAKIVIGVIVLVLIGWGVSSYKAKPKVAGEPIKIGVITVLTGPFADYGEEMRKGIEEASASGVSFVFEDDKCDPKEAVSAFQKLTDIEKVEFIIGPGCGSPQEATVPLLAGKGAMAIAPSAASKELFTKSGGNFFNIQYSLEDESKFVAESLYNKGLKRVALVTYGNAFSKTHGDSFKANFKGTIAIDTTLLDNGTNLLSELTKIKTAKVDAIYSPDISFFFGGGMKKLEQLGIKVPVYTTYVAELPAAREVVGGVYYSFPGDLSGNKGATFELSKQSAILLVDLVTQCNGEVSCVKEKIVSSGKFDSSGTMKRTIILKQIKDGQPIEIK